jgi:hypothetical protein
MRDDELDYVRGGELDDVEERIQALEGRIEELEDGRGPSRDGGAGAYILGTVIAVVLSWSRNASILWCILHGALSWIYVIYFAFTR